MVDRLAIVIPAYKDSFFREALESISSQTCRDFTLYIGDDCSPYDIQKIVNEFSGKLNIVYHRFESNLGGADLVAQWKRCVDLTRGESYIWLFSDDDVMEKNCVEEFYKVLETNKNSELFHFDVKIINDDGIVTRIPNAYPDKLDGLSYYKGKIRGTYMSLVVENIFSRSIYERCGGFENFDLAWGSDTITWIKFSEKNGFTNIKDAFVLWRSGSQNISPNLSSAIVERKMIAMTNGFNWVYDYFKQRGKRCWLANIRGFLSRAIYFAPYTKKDVLTNCIKNFCKRHNCSILYYPMLIIVMMRTK